MRASIAAFASALLATSLIAAAPLEQTPPPAEVPPQPTAVTYHFGGVGSVPADEANYNSTTSGFAPMTGKAPTSTTTRSKQITNYVGGPNTKCSGNNLLPTFQGYLEEATVSGEVKVSVPAVGNGEQVKFAIFDAATGCNDSWTPPLAVGDAKLPMGSGTLTGATFVATPKKVSTLIVMFYADTLTAAQGRISYGSTTASGTLTFTCTAKDKPGVTGEVCTLY